ASYYRKTIFLVVAVLGRVSCNGGIYWTAAAIRRDPCYFPVVEDRAQPFVASMEGPRCHHPGERQPLPLISDTGAALGVRRVGVLDCRRLARHESVLPVVDRMGKGVRQHEIKSAGHAAANRKRRPVVHAGRGTFEDINCPQLRNRPYERIDAGRKG